MRFRPGVLMLVLAGSAFMGTAVAQTPARPSPAESATVLQGRPASRTESSDETSKHVTIPDAERAKVAVVIVRKGGRYFWASRENRELERRVSGAFTYFVDRTEGGYIRVFDRSTLPESLRPDGPQFEYTEHVPVWRNTVTYWGVLDRFDP
jgi:hypothetical protein